MIFDIIGIISKFLMINGSTNRNRKIMCCNQCGNPLEEGATFCGTCGARVDIDNRVMKNVESSANPKKKLVFLVPVILVIFVVIIAASGKDEVDYIATVENLKLFEDSIGYDYICKEVFNEYITSPKWKERKDGDTHYVDISGKVKGTDCKAVITISVLPMENHNDMAWYVVETVTLDDAELPTQDAAVEFVYYMFEAYDIDVDFVELVKYDNWQYSFLL